MRLWHKCVNLAKFFRNAFLEDTFLKPPFELSLNYPVFSFINNSLYMNFCITVLDAHNYSDFQGSVLVNITELGNNTSTL